uniref:Transmembrane protein 174 n=1 Tax=Oncorhynchus tshawytscha TaxID=74940 RepID=A0A8C8LM85_ONCTS
LSLSPSLPPSLSPTCRSLMGIRSGATLMFPGIFLGLVGMTFTDMGWLKYSVSCRGTFILISICKFRMLSCRACKQSDYDKDLSELLEIPGSGQSFVFNGINQPIMFHGATVGQYIPALYRSVTQEPNLDDAGPILHRPMGAQWDSQSRLDVIQPGFEPGTVVTPLALRYSPLDRCTTLELPLQEYPSELLPENLCSFLNYKPPPTSFYRPAYSPDMSPIEHVRDALDQRL